jgi:hypothetical protein
MVAEWVYGPLPSATLFAEIGERCMGCGHIRLSPGLLAFTRLEVKPTDCVVLFRARCRADPFQMCGMNAWFLMKFPTRDRSWLMLQSGVARSTPASPPKKDSNRTTTRCMHSARPARPSSEARRARAGSSSGRPTMTAASRAVRWSGRPCSNCWRISARV